MCDPLTDPACVAQSIVGGVSGSILDQMSKWWTDAYSSMTDAFSKAFLKAGDVSIAQLQSSGLWKLEVGVGATIAAGLMIWAGARTAWTHSGEPIAAGVAGGIKAVFATAMVFVIVTALLGIADQLTQAVINATAADKDAFVAKVGQLASINSLNGGPGALSFLFSLLGVLIMAVLWAEMLIRAAGIVIVTLSTPIGAAGLVSSRTAGWWRKMVSAEVALIFVKPIVALVLAVGFTVSHDSTGIQGSLVGFMVLGAAAVAWPVVGRMLTFFEGTFAIGGMAAAFGLAEAARGRIGGGGGSNGSQPMWQSMEQASSRAGAGAGSGSPGLGTGAEVADVSVAAGESMAAAGGGLGSAAAGIAGGTAAAGAAAGGAGGAAAAGAATGGVGALAVVGKQLATKAVVAPGQLVGRAGDLAGLDGGTSGTEGARGMSAEQALAPNGMPPDGGGEEV